MQKAYLVVKHIVTDPAKFKEYLAMVGPMIAKHGGRSLTKGNAHQSEGGHWKPELVAPNSPICIPSRLGTIRTNTNR